LSPRSYPAGGRSFRPSMPSAPMAFVQSFWIPRETALRFIPDELLPNERKRPGITFPLGRLPLFRELAGTIQGRTVHNGVVNTIAKSYGHFPVLFSPIPIDRTFGVF